MDSIRNMAGSVGGWIKRNVTGSDGQGDYTPKDPQAKEIRDSLEKMEEKVSAIQQDIAQIGQTSALHPPKLSDVSDKELVIMGTAGGAAVGGVLGMASGLLDTALDETQIEVTKTSHDIMKPVMKGFDHKMVEDSDSQGMLKGYQHNYSPRIEYQKVGDYETKSATATHTLDKDSPVTQGVKGMIGGALTGGAIAVGVAVGRKLMKKGEFQGREDRPVEGESKVIATGAAIGAVGGAVAGGLGGILEASHVDSKTITFEKPVMEKVTIGQMPQNTYQSIFDIYREEQVPKKDVVVDGPKMEKGFLGMGEKPAMEKVTQEVAVQPRFGIMGQVMGGAVLGAIGGGLMGIVANVIRKII